MNKGWIPRLSVMLLALLLISFPTAGQNNNEAEVLLQAAAQKATMEGDLQEAIRLCQQILAEYSDSRPVAARALLQMGRCYEKLGKDEARKAYQQLISDYADQSEQVKLARVRLAVLSKTSDADKKPVFATRQVLANPIPGSYMISLSPDGKYLSVIGQNDQLAVRDLETGVIRLITNEGGGGDPLSSRWSPDGKYIAYVWDTGPYQDLRVISAEGGKSRILVDNKWGGDMKVFDWSPDSKEILTLLEKNDGTQQIVMVSAANGTTTVLKTFEGFGLFNVPGYGSQVMRFSRDGQYIAYEYPQDKGVPEHDIFVISTDGKREFPLVQHPADDHLLGWPPNGESILFSSDRQGSLDVWLQTVSGGKAQGLPALVKKGVDQIVPLVFTQDGAFYYQLRGQGIDVYSARIDFRSGKVLTPPEVIIKSNEGRNSWPDYSADGKYLAYLTTQSRQNFDFNTLCIRSLESGKEREFTTRFERLAGTQWSPDGQSLFLTAWDDQGAGIYRVNAQTGAFFLIVRKKLPEWFSYRPINCHRVTPDGKTIIYLRLEEPGPFRIIARNLITGEEKLLHTGLLPRFSISPNGQWLALIYGYKRKGLRVMSLSDGWLKDLFNFEDDSPKLPAAIEWTADGKYIIFQRNNREKDGMGLALWRISADGGEPQKLNLPMGVYPDMSVHPDGQHLVFGSFSTGLKTTAGIWIMENFLPPDSSTSK